MKIVIDVDEDIYNYIQTEGYDEHSDKRFDYQIRFAVKDGTPLPKGHGRLIDADSLEYTCNADECGMLTGCNHCQYHIVTEHELDNAPTIIEGSVNE